jgi:hypothetical protein
MPLRIGGAVALPVQSQQSPMESQGFEYEALPENGKR